MGEMCVTISAADDKRLGWGVRLGYSIGDLGLNFFWQAIGLFLYFFYTDVMGISPIWAGIAYSIASIWDGISDPIMGAIADRTRTRLGRYRPYLLAGAIPCAICFALAFWVPPLKGAALVAYAILTHVALRTAYTVMSIPFSSLSARITSDSNERAVIAGCRVFFAAIGGLTVAFIFPLLVAMLGEGREDVGYAMSAAILGAISVVIISITFFTTHEPAEVAAPATGFSISSILTNFVQDIAQFWGMLRLNLPLAQVFGAVTVTSIALTMFGKCILYWFKYGLNDMAAVKFALPMPALVVMLTLPLWIAFARRTSKRLAWMLGSAIAAIGYIGFFFNPVETTPATILFMLVITAGQSSYAVMFWSMVPDTVEYNEWKLGSREEAKIFGFAAFAQKVALGINAILLGQMLSFVGFVANQPQSPEAVLGIKAIMSLVPLAGVFLSVACLWRYPIDATFHRQMLGEIAIRKAGV